jgi:hypothetical protein
LQKNQDHLQQYQAQFVAMKAEAEQEKTQSKLVLRKAEEQTKQAEQQMEQVLAHVRQKEEARQQNEGNTDAANDDDNDGNEEMNEEPVYPIEHNDDKDDNRNGDEKEPVYPTHHQLIPKPKKFQRSSKAQVPVLGAWLPHNMAPPADPTYLLIVSLPHPCKNIEPADHDSQLKELQKMQGLVQQVTNMRNKHQACTRVPQEFKKRIVRNWSVNCNECLTWL